MINMVSKRVGMSLTLGEGHILETRQMHKLFEQTNTPACIQYWRGHVSSFPQPPHSLFLCLSKYAQFTNINYCEMSPFDILET